MEGFILVFVECEDKFYYPAALKKKINNDF